MDITTADLRNAVNFPLGGWAPYESLYGCAPPNYVLSKDSTIALMLKQAPATAYYRGNDEDPLSFALRDAKATKVPNGEWTTMDVNGNRVPTMEGRDYTIYRLPQRKRCDHPMDLGDHEDFAQ